MGIKEAVLRYISKDALDTTITIVKNKEFKKFLFSVSDIWGGDGNKDEKWEKASVLVDKLSDTTYDVCFMQLLDVVQKAKSKCEPFKNSEAQVADIMAHLPRLKDRQELVLLVIKERRKQYGLKV